MIKEQEEFLTEAQKEEGLTNEQEKDDLLIQKLKQGSVLVDFWASWCGPCKKLTPIIDAIEAELKNAPDKNVNIYKINIDEFPNIATQYNIRSIPTLIFLRDNIEQDRVVGFVSKSEIMELIEQKLLKNGSN